MNSDSQRLFNLLCDRMEEGIGELLQEVVDQNIPFRLHLAKSICDDFKIVRTPQSNARLLQAFCDELPNQEDVKIFLILYLSHWDEK